MRLPLIIGHRGARGFAPENSWSGFKKARELRIDGIELDIHLTKDNQIVVIHDTNLRRLTGENVDLKNFTFQELQKYNIAHYFSPYLEKITRRIPEEKKYFIELRALDDHKYFINVFGANRYRKISFYLFWDGEKFSTIKKLIIPRQIGIRKGLKLLKIKKEDKISQLKKNELLSIDQRIPLLKDILKVFKNKSTLINIEIKGGERLYPGIIDRLIKEIEDFPPQSLLFSLFDRKTALMMKKKYPHLQVNYLSLQPIIPGTYLNDLDGLNYYYLWVTSRLIERLHQKKKTIYVWTVNQELDMIRFILSGVDGIITDYPQVLKKISKTLRSLFVGFE
ncbi:MAG: glycerophosphodiester phosphodiesterase family protein [Candidatus Caldatribacteriota bacterium]